MPTHRDEKELCGWTVGRAGEYAAALPLEKNIVLYVFAETMFHVKHGFVFSNHSDYVINTQLLWMREAVHRFNGSLRAVGTVQG